MADTDDTSKVRPSRNPSMNRDLKQIEAPARWLSPDDRARLAESMIASWRSHAG
jgi:hypothetical protein